MRGGGSYDEIFTNGIGAPELRNMRREERGFKIVNLSIISLPRLFLTTPRSKRRPLLLCPSQRLDNPLREL